MDQDDNKNIESKFEIDPDYETTNTAIRRAELQGEEENKVKTIIQEELDKELQMRHKQLEELEDKIFKAQKLLHMVRYVLISSYYKNRVIDESVGTESSNIIAGQNRIHPAIKKLIGKNTSLKVFTARAKRKAAKTKPESSWEIETEAKKIRLETKELNKTKSADIKVVKTEPNISRLKEEPITNRNKVQHRLVIGNVSYFKKSLEKNSLTHKWMAYVKIYKGLSAGSEVTNLVINKVVFYLHPSYKPHDVVDISQPPYHLSRRGWGEFPLRLKIFFKSPMNKPVDVIHELKLDSTFTERQTLGNQTTVPLFLYEDWNPTIKKEDLDFKKDLNVCNNMHGNNNNVTLSNTLSSPTLNNEIISIESIKTEPTTSYEHDYFSIKEENFPVDEEFIIKEEPVFESQLEQEVKFEFLDYSLRDHSYSLSPNKEGQKSPKKHRSPVKQAYNDLIYGVGPHYLDPLRSKARNVRPKIVNNVNESPEKLSKPVVKVLKTVTGQSIRFLPESFNQVLLNNGSVVSVKVLKPPSANRVVRAKDNLNSKFLNCSGRNSDLQVQSTVKDLVRKEKLLLKLPEHKLKNMGQVLSYLFKRLPLWSSETQNVDYKCTYPFTATSEEEFRSWNIGKRLSAEWSRAKAIKRIISAEPCSRGWTTKAIFMYGRSHLYTPLVPTYRLFEPESPEKALILSSFYCNSFQNGFDNISSFAVKNEDEAINITSPNKSVIDPNFTSVESCIDISDPSLLSECLFVKERALDVGVILKPEVLDTDVCMNAAERVLFEAMKCFAENLVRRAVNHMICQQSYVDETSEITVNEINKALEERPEFRSLRKFKENKMLIDYFS